MSEKKSQTFLNNINSPEDLKRFYAEQKLHMDELTTEIRDLIVETVSQNGGHLASNLGVVELTIALHISFDSPTDSIVFDVGHQSYVHKILTGRREDMPKLRKTGGLSGFPKTEESPHDAFNTGHSSTSISAAMGIMRAKRLKGDDSAVVALIGDAAIAGGMSFEALDDLGQSELPLIIVLNDNTMAISNTVGAMGTHFSKLRSSVRYISFKDKTRKLVLKIPRVGEPVASWLERTKNRIKYFLLPNAIFEPMGITYIGPVNGHNVDDLCDAFAMAKRIKRPVIVHAVTKKGKGYKPAEDNPMKFHGIGHFNITNGSDDANKKISNSEIFGQALVELAKDDENIVAITAAMPNSTGLMPFSKLFPNRFFDVGIAEQHAITLAAGMSIGGLKPVAAIYSTFLQRAYDQILHDICLQSLPVVFAVDRAGLVGEDGETHQGVYDIAYLLPLPNIMILSPASIFELEEMLKFALKQNCPVAVRYNRGVLAKLPMTVPLDTGRWEIMRPVSKVTVIATGRLVAAAVRASAGLDVGVINARFLKPMDYDTLDAVGNISTRVITIEDGLASSGFGSMVAKYFSENMPGVQVECLGVPDMPIPQATVDMQDEMCGISVVQIREKLIRYNHEV